jgi:DNA-binding IclR family transcriptional regulator
MQHCQQNFIIDVIIGEIVATYATKIIMSEMQSLARGLRILDLIASADHALGVTEIATILDVDKSSVSRLVKTLVKYEYVQPDTGSRGYVLGRRFRQISWHLLNRMPVREKAKPYLYRLVEQTGECAHTAVYSEGKALMIDDVQAEASLRVVGGIGRMIPLHCTAVGKALLAFSDLPTPTHLNMETSRTITDPETLAWHLEQIRDLGYALDDEEHQEGVRCMAAPVYDYMGTVIAVIGISGPTVRMTDRRIPELAQMVMEAARELSDDLRFAASPGRTKSLARNQLLEE